MITNVRGQSNSMRVREAPPAEEVIEAIAQLALRILFVFATTLMAASSCPLRLRDIVLPMVSIGSAFLSAFFYLPEKVEEKSPTSSPRLPTIWEEEEEKI